MNRTALLLSTAAFALAAAVAGLSATLAVAKIEERSASDIRRSLLLNGHEWAEVSVDGLQVFLDGTAPDEATRFQALSVASSVVDAARVVDLMEVAQRDAIAPPRFSIELLRNDDGISLIGLIPAATDRQELIDRIEAAAPGVEVSDLLEVADDPAPQGWNAALGFGLAALKELPRAKISLGADRIEVQSIAESDAEKARLERQLKGKAPRGVKLALDIAAPRPAIAPFTLRFAMGGDEGPRFDACSAATPQGQKRIIEAARNAGLEGEARCTIGLGVPSPSWPDAASRAIRALAAMGAGTVTFTDTDISLIVPAEVDEALFETEAGKLDADLPEGFSLHASRTEPVAEGTEGAAEPLEFVATRSPEGQVQLRGRVTDERARAAVDSFARSRFGVETLSNAARLAEEGTPAEGWTPRVLAGLDAMAVLHNGTLKVTEDVVDIRGVSGIRDARAEITRILAEALGEGGEFAISVRYDESMDPLAGLPTPEECAAQINAVLKKRQITFDPGAATIDSDARESVDRIAEILRKCEDVQMEVAGYTDSQGRESMNLALSQSRAEAVLTALAARRVLTSNLEAKGYGEADPIADNGTEAGREANRRIEFRLISSETPQAGTDGGDGQADGDAATNTDTDSGTGSAAAD